MDNGKKIELTVVIENEAAINLYKKIGFLIEGHIRRNYKEILRICTMMII